MRYIASIFCLSFVLFFIQALPCDSIKRNHLQSKQSKLRSGNSLQYDIAKIAKHSKHGSKDPTIDVVEKGDPTRENFKAKAKIKHHKQQKFKSEAKSDKKKHHQVARARHVEERGNYRPRNQYRGQRNRATNTNQPQQPQQPQQQFQNPQSPVPSFGFPFFQPIPLWSRPAQNQPMGSQNSPNGGQYHPMGANMKQLENTYLQFGNALQGLRGAQNTNLNNAQHVSYVVPFLRTLDNSYSTIYDQWKHLQHPYPNILPRYGYPNMLPRYGYPNPPYLLNDLNSIYPLSDPLNIFRYTTQLADFNTRYADLLNVLHTSAMSYPYWLRHYQNGVWDERLKNVQNRLWNERFNNIHDSLWNGRLNRFPNSLWNLNDVRPTQHIVVHHSKPPTPEVRYVVNHPKPASDVHVVVDEPHTPQPSQGIQYVIHNSSPPADKTINLSTENGQGKKLMNRQESSNWVNKKRTVS